MCSAGDCWLVGVSVARLVEFGHRGVGEVAAGDDPLVVLVGQNGAAKAQGDSSEGISSTSELKRKEPLAVFDLEAENTYADHVRPSVRGTIIRGPEERRVILAVARRGSQR